MQYTWFLGWVIGNELFTYFKVDTPTVSRELDLLFFWVVKIQTDEKPISLINVLDQRKLRSTRGCRKS